MRRSKIKATVCVGRRNIDTSRKAKENERANEGTIPSNELPEPNEFKTTDKPEIEDTNSSACSIAVVESPANPLPPPQSEIFSIAVSDPSIPISPSSVAESMTAEATHENLSLPGNRSLLNRSKKRAVPKFRDRKVGSSVLEIDQPISDPTGTTSETGHISNISSVEESTLNSPADHSQILETIPQIHYVTPTSPNKICRSKVKAVPVLGNRKPFSSTSDSEDGIKRSNSSRTRTESQSSTISGIQDATIEQPPTSKKLENCSDMKRKLRKSEGSKKLAEARREFARKYVDGKPDYKRLTMMDLIFYNPTTNPMKYEKNKSEATDKTSDPAKQTEEDVDDPSEKNDEPINKSDDEDDIIAPRIKIGPTGEIILDEKSLVIENKKVKKAQEAIERSEAVDGDLDRPYGVYKKLKRSKDWTQSETVKFYRALSTVGTDFTLMTELFPRRTRRELKVKFKKEEKTNQALVDQAIMKPCNFNYEELKTEFEMIDIETLEIEQQQIKEKELNKRKQNRKSAKLLNLTQNDCLTNNTQYNSGIITSPKEVEPENIKLVKKRCTIRKQVKFPKPPKKLDILSALSESDSSDQDSTDSEETFVRNQTQTTRYGRKTKQREIYEPTIDRDEELIIQKKIRKPNPEPEPSQKPGSIMMISSETPDGQSVVKIFMVTDDKVTNGDKNETNPQNLLPIAMIRTDHSDDEVEGEIVENNYTIPADNEENM